MTENPSLMEFPCRFPLKIIGQNTEQFRVDVLKLIYHYFPSTEEKDIVYNASQQGTYLSMTITVLVLDQPTLDALYIQLQKHPEIKMVF